MWLVATEQAPWGQLVVTAWPYGHDLNARETTWGGWVFCEETSELDGKWLESGSWATRVPTRRQSLGPRLDLNHKETSGHWGDYPKHCWRWPLNCLRQQNCFPKDSPRQDFKLSTENVQDRPIYRHRKYTSDCLRPGVGVVSDGKQTQRFFLERWKCSKIRLWWWLHNSENKLKFIQFYT